MTERYFDALEQQLAGLCRQRAHHRRRAHRILVRPTGHLPHRSRAAGVIALIGSVVVVAAVGVIALGLRSQAGYQGKPPAHSSGGAIAPAQRRAAQPYLTAAIGPVLRGRCGKRPPHKSQAVSQGVPDPALLSILGVLRRPREAQDIPRPAPGSHRSLPIWTKDSFVRYIRRARVVNGISYWIVPTVNAGQLSARCAASIARRLRHELPTVPRSLRAAVTSLGDQQVAERGPHTSVTVVEQGPNLGAGFGGESIDDIQQRGMFGGDNTKHGARLIALLPDGVSTVQIVYPSIHAGGRVRKAFSITARVVDNVMVTNTPRNAAAPFGEKMIWRAANGALIKTVPSR
ncbi:MAG: hypothetical protein WAU75_00075 [Solirubrobacteraceae bacterium]